MLLMKPSPLKPVSQQIVHHCIQLRRTIHWDGRCWTIWYSWINQAFYEHKRSGRMVVFVEPIETSWSKIILALKISTSCENLAPIIGTILYVWSASKQTRMQSFAGLPLHHLSMHIPESSGCCGPLHHENILLAKFNEQLVSTTH